MLVNVVDLKETMEKSNSWSNPLLDPLRKKQKLHVGGNGKKGKTSYDDIKMFRA